MEELNLIVDIKEFVDSNFEKNEIDVEYYEVEDRYKELFGHGIPLEMIPSGITKSQIIDAMNQSIKSNSDEVFSMLNISIDENALY